MVATVILIDCLSKVEPVRIHCYIHLVKDVFHTAGKGIWIIEVFML